MAQICIYVKSSITVNVFDSNIYLFWGKNMYLFCYLSVTLLSYMCLYLYLNFMQR